MNSETLSNVSEMICNEREREYYIVYSTQLAVEYVHVYYIVLYGGQVIFEQNRTGNATIFQRVK